MHQTIFQNGAFRESLIEGWLKGINESDKLPIIYNNEKMGPYWDTEEMTDHWKNVDFPAVHYTGW